MLHETDALRKVIVSVIQKVNAQARRTGFVDPTLILIPAIKFNVFLSRIFVERLLNPDHTKPTLTSSFMDQNKQFVLMQMRKHLMKFARQDILRPLNFNHARVVQAYISCSHNNSCRKRLPTQRLQLGLIIEFRE